MNRKSILLIGSICIVLLLTVFTNMDWIQNILSPADDNTDSPGTVISPDTGTVDSSSSSVSEALGNNQGNHEDAQDYTWNSSEITPITLHMASISVDDKTRVTVDGTRLTLTSSGTYSISGTLENGQIIIDTTDDEVVRLIFDGVNISSATTAPIYVANAEKTVIYLTSDTENYVTDSEGNQDNATLFSNDDLTIYGNGSLTVTGNANDAIRSDDGLIIKSGNITVISVDDGITGKDYLVIEGGSVTVHSGGDGLKSSNTEREDRGYIYIKAAKIAITSTQGDAITAQTDLLVDDGLITVKSGGGSSTPINHDISTKGLKSGVNLILDNGEFAISSSDDSIHSNGRVIINNGTYALASGDDAIHADTSLEINGGVFQISHSFEGLESALIIIKNGVIHLASSDNGMDADRTDPGDVKTGNISIENSVLTITSGGDALQAETNILITRGNVTVTAGGGSGSNSLGSAKGVKADVNVRIDGGVFVVNSADDALHSNGKITIDGGSFVLSTRDDGIHADSSVEVNGGDLSIITSYEGIESGAISINGGVIHITSNDDGMNVIGENQSPGPRGRPGQETYSSDNYLHLYGGYVYIDAVGDGIDVNGVVEMTAGSLIINGPIANDNGALDFGAFKITGGFLLAVGSSGMAQAPGTTSTQESVSLRFGAAIQAGTLVHIQTSDGIGVFSFIATKRYQSMVFSSPDLLPGATYNFYIEGSVTGRITDGLCLDGTYTPGTLLGSFTV